MQDIGGEVDKTGLAEEASTFNTQERADKLNQLIKVDQKGRLRDKTSTIEISGTKANKIAKKLGFTVLPKQKVNPLKTK